MNVAKDVQANLQLYMWLKKNSYWIIQDLEFAWKVHLFIFSTSELVSWGSCKKKKTPFHYLFIISHRCLWICSGCIVFSCLCLSLCWHLSRHIFTGVIYSEPTNIYAPVIPGIALGVRLAVQRHTRCLVVAANVACRVVIKAKRTRCSPSMHYEGCVREHVFMTVFLRVQSVRQWWNVDCEKKHNVLAAWRSMEHVPGHPRRRHGRENDSSRSIPETWW